MLKLNLMILCLLVSSLYAANDKVFTKKTIELEIEQLKKQIEEEENVWAEEKAREASSEKKRKQRIVELENQKVLLKTSIVQLETEIQKGLNQIENSKNQKKYLSKKFEDLNSDILEQVLFFKEVLESTIPYQYDKRYGGINLLEQDLRKKTISPEEGFSRLFASYQKELRLASDAELYSGEVQIQSGDQVAVKYIRVGKQLLAYASPTGAHVGILRKKNNKNWEWVREDELDLASRESIRVAVGTAEGKEVPGFVEVPFWLADFELGVEEKNDSLETQLESEESK